VAHEGPALGLYFVHAGEDVVEGSDGLGDVRALVEHDAVGAFAGRRVGDLGPCGLSGLGEGLQDLRRPDSRHVRGFAEGENLPGYFGEPFEADLDGQVASGDHDGHARVSHGGQQDRWEVREALPGFDLQHEAEVVGGRGVEPVEHMLDVGGGADKDTATMSACAAMNGRWESSSGVSAGVLTFTAGRLPGRWYGYRSYDTHVGGQQIVAVHAEPTGDLAGIAVGAALGAYRTGSLGAVAADVLARRDATTVGVVGAGLQAWTQLRALSAVRQLSDVAIYGRTPQRRSTSADRVQAELGIPARAVTTAREAVAARDIVVLATSSPTPVLDAGWIAPGTAVTTVGPKQVARAEFGLDLPARAQLIVTDSLPQLRADDPPALLANAPVVSLGAILAEDHPGRPNPDAITLYASVGLAGTEPYLLADLLAL